MRKPDGAVAFYALSIVLISVSLLGYVIWVGKLLSAPGRSHASWPQRPH